MLALSAKLDSLLSTRTGSGADDEAGTGDVEVSNSAAEAGGAGRAEGVRVQLAIAKRRVELLEARLATLENPPMNATSPRATQSFLSGGGGSATLENPPPSGSPPRQVPPRSPLREILIPNHPGGNPGATGWFL